MGGHVTAAAIEQYPNRTCPAGKRGRFCRELVEYLGELAGGVKYSGAVQMCGVTGDTRLFDFFHDFNLVAAYLADVEVPRPPPPDFTTAYLPLIQRELCPGTRTDFYLNDQPLAFAGATTFVCMQNEDRHQLARAIGACPGLQK